MNELTKNEIRNRLVLESWRNGMSDTKWQKVAEIIAKKHSVTLEDILVEFNTQFDVLMRSR